MNDNDAFRSEVAAHAERHGLLLLLDGELPDGGPAYKLTSGPGPYVFVPKSDLEHIEKYLCKLDESDGS